jgi:hypothetical protein
MPNLTPEELGRWQETTLKKSVSKSPVRPPSFETTSQIELKDIFTHRDVGDANYMPDSGLLQTLSLS